MPLQLKFNVYNSTGSTCTALAGALVDIWHCDALGNYSDNSGGMGTPTRSGRSSCAATR